MVKNITVSEKTWTLLNLEKMRKGVKSYDDILLPLLKNNNKKKKKSLWDMEVSELLSRF